MKLPPLTGLQFAVIDALGTHTMLGKDLRALLAERGTKKTLASFYQLMSRLAESGFVHGQYRATEIDGYTVNFSEYKITGKGVTAWNRTREYYIDTSGARELMRKGGAACA